MEDKEKLHAELVQEVVKFLFAKFEALSEQERKYIAPASVEAIAWFAAAECAAYCKKNGLNGEQAMERIVEFENYFTDVIEHELAGRLSDN